MRTTSLKTLFAGVVLAATVGASAPAAAYESDYEYYRRYGHHRPRYDIGTESLGFLGGLALGHALSQRRRERCYTVPVLNRDHTRRLGSALVCD